MPTPTIHSPTINSKLKYNDSTLIGNTIQTEMHHDNTLENCTEGLDQRGYTHFAASYTTSLMQYIKYKCKHTMLQNYNEKAMPYMYYMCTLPGKNAKNA